MTAGRRARGTTEGGVPLPVEPAAVPETAAQPPGGGRRASRSSLALMGSAVGSGLLTLAFWSIVARRDGPGAVGAASAEISAITFLAGVASLNMINVFARFLPEAGHRARRLVASGYGAAAVAGLVVGVAFSLTPYADGLVVGGTAGRIGFVVMVVVMSMFMIQDGGLVGLGRALWVPVENVAVGTVRLVSLPLVGLVTVGAVAALWSWAIATVVAVVVLTVAVVGPLAARESHRDTALPSRGRLVRFIAVESVSTAVSSSVSAFLPAIVKRTHGTLAAGYFYVPWLAATTASLLVMSILISMVREAVADPTRAGAVIRSQIRLCVALVAVMVVACTALPGVLLSVLGADFASAGAELLRWIGGSLPGTAIGLLYWSLCLIRQRPWPVFGMNAAITVTVIAGVYLTRDQPVGTIGAVYFAVQWAVAVAVAWPTLRALRQMMHTTPEGRSA